MNSIFDGYAPYKGDIQFRKQGSLIAFESGEAVASRSVQCSGTAGTLFIELGTNVYAGMVIGQSGNRRILSSTSARPSIVTITRSSGSG